jgi:DNA adenine methylase
METVNDLHGELINLARVVQHDELSVRLFDQMNRSMMHEGLMAEAEARYLALGNVPAPDVPDLDRARDYMLCSWLGRNGVAGTESYNQGFCVRYTANGGHAATRFQSVADSIPAWWKRLRNVTVMNRDGFELIGRIDDQPGTVVYVDPPYVTKGAKYIYDFERADHERLAQELRRFTKARVVVSYYDHPTVRSLYDGWHFVPCSVAKSLVNQGMRDRTGVVRAPEVLIVREPGRLVLT